MKKTKQKLIIVLSAIVVLIVIAVINFMGIFDPYSDYKQLEAYEIFNVKDYDEYYVYFYSTEDKESIDSENGLKELGRAKDNIYYVNIKNKEDGINAVNWNEYGEVERIKASTLIKVKNQKIIACYTGIDQLKEVKQDILEENWE